MQSNHCQIQDLSRMPRNPGALPGGLRQRVYLAFLRVLGHDRKRIIKRQISRFYASTHRLTDQKDGATAPEAAATPLSAGDIVRVRPREEIEATLSPFQDYKGCTIIEDMWQYCGTTQRVLKPVRRFVDERDYSVKRASGVVLLEGLICQGTEYFGPCDRSCFYFWREEWLERVE
jgi:hypothetical protein